MIIRAITNKDKKLLDKMWEFDTEEVLYGWINSLNTKKRARVLTLKVLVEWAIIDEQVSNMDCFPDVHLLLDPIFT